MARNCSRGETDFVLNPYWESEAELYAEFEHFGIAPEEHVLVADADAGEPLGLAGFMRRPHATDAGMFCPIVRREERGHGLGGELLRAAQRHGSEELGIKLMTAGLGTRNRAGYSLLTSHGFRAVRQAFLMRCDTRPVLDARPLDGLDVAIAGLEDAEDILSIYETCGFEGRSLDAMRGVLADGLHVHTVARRAGEAAAFVELEIHWPERPWVAFVGVATALRDRGLGSSLVSWALEREFDRGARAGQLMLSPANRTALRAYEKVGFRRHRLIDVLEKSV